jgi:two-component system cell cycle sensor histidine kinase/response regulator CckA
MGKYSFGSNVKDSYPNRKGKDKINYQFVLDNIPSPVSLWKMNGEDFLLVYLNKAAEKTIKPELSVGTQLSVALPTEYRKVFYPLSSGYSNNSSSQIMLDEDMLLIISKPSQESQTGTKWNKYKNEPFETIIEQSQFSIIITDIDGNIEFVNPKFVNLTGYTQEEVIGKNPRILKSGRTPPEEYKKLWDTILSGNIWKGDFINKRKDGELYYEFAIIAPIFDSKGNITNFIAIKEDVTQLRKAEEELKKSEKLAALGKMAAYVAHEIKTPLNSMKINIDRLEQKTIDNDSKKSLSAIQKELKRLANLLKNTLQFSNQTSLPFIEVNLHKKIENVRESLEPILRERGVTLVNRTSDHNIFGDAQQLLTLFVQLIENSIDSMDSGGEIEISSELKGDQCFIYVKDNGCGVDCSGNIFEPFITTKSAGTGLGLAIVKNIIDNHKGSIRLVSSKQGETIFEIILKSSREKCGKTTNN